MHTTRLIVAIVIAATLGGCGAQSDAPPEDSSTSAATSAATTSVASSSASAAVGVLFEDSFDDRAKSVASWGEVDDPEFGTLKFEGGDQRWRSRGRYVSWTWDVYDAFLAGKGPDLRDITVRAEGTVLKGTGVVGVACREQKDTDAEYEWYEFVARDGFAAIRIADDRGHLEVLAESKDIALPLGTPFTIAGTCADDANGTAQLRFDLNGATVLTAEVRDPLGNGFPALQLWTFPMHEQTDIDWHSFRVTSAAPA